MSYLHLTNFRCHTNKKINLPENGLVLLDGMSGQGKSTILDAFSYALFGKPNKPYTFGKSTCQVLLYLKSLDMSVTRTSRPNRLLVKWAGETYEDAGAQGIINSQICTQEEFDYGCYIKQKSADSLVTMTPTQQLEFVQAMSFDDHNVTIKERVKTLTQTQEKKLSTITNKVDYLEKEIESMSSFKAIDNPLEKKTEEEAKEYIVQLTASKKSNNTRLKEIDIQIADIEDSLEAYKDYSAAKVSLENLEEPDTDEKIEKIKKLYRKLNDLEKTKENLKKKDEVVILLEECQREIDARELELETCSVLSPEKLKEYKAYIKQHDKYLDLQDELDEVSRKLKKIKKPETEFETERYIELLEKRDTNKQELKEYNSHKKEYDELLQELNDLLSEQADENFLGLSPKQAHKALSNYIKENSYVFECPNCECHLSKVGENYVVTEDEVGGAMDDKMHEKLLEFKSQIKKFHSLLKKEKPFFDSTELTDLLELKSSWEEYTKNSQSLIDKQKDLKEKLNILKEYSSTATQEAYEKEIDESENNSKIRYKCEKIIQENKDKIVQLKLKKINLSDDETSEDNLNQEIFELKQILPYSTLKQYLEVQDKLTMAYSKQAQKVKNLSQELSEESEQDLLEKLKDLKKEKEYKKRETSLLEENIAEWNQKLLDYAQKYLPYQKKKEVEKSLRNEKKLVEEIENKLKKLYLIRDKCRQAEILSIEETVQSINIQSKYYLDLMFPMYPIEVTLENYKVTGKGSSARTKGQLNMSIYYKNNQYDSVNQLSGGERDKLNLAFILAINDMIGSKILFLDECLSSLDSETNTDIYMFLKKHSTNRLTIAISHEAVRGLFDHTIDV